MFDIASGNLRPPSDGRLSDTALALYRGVSRYLRNAGYSTAPEMILPSGRRADMIALGSDGSLLIIEIKSSVADFRSDLKWRAYLDHCDRFYFAIARSIPVELIPADVGLFLADEYGAEVVRESPSRKLASATRRALLIRFGRTAADRMQNLIDPESRSGELSY